MKIIVITLILCLMFTVTPSGNVVVKEIPPVKVQVPIQNFTARQLFDILKYYADRMDSLTLRDIEYIVYIDYHIDYVWCKLYEHAMRKNTRLRQHYEKYYKVFMAYTIYNYMLYRVVKNFRMFIENLNITALEEAYRLIIKYRLVEWSYTAYWLHYTGEAASGKINELFIRVYKTVHVICIITVALHQLLQPIVKHNQPSFFFK